MKIGQECISEIGREVHGVNHPNEDVENDVEESCRAKVKDFMVQKGIVIFAIFIGLGTVQNSYRSVIQSDQKALNIFKYSLVVSLLYL